MKTISEFFAMLKIALMTPKVLWFTIIGMVIGAVFTCLLKAEWPGFPCLIFSFVALLLSKKVNKQTKERKFDWWAASMMFVGGLSMSGLLSL